jgi:hypothetical protein
MITDEQKTKLNSIISETAGLIDRIDKGVVKGQEAEDFFANQIRIVKGLFVNTCDEWRIVDRWENENGFVWHSVYKPGVYAGEKEKGRLMKFVEVVNRLMPSNSPPLTKKEFHFSATEAFEAKRFICSLFRASGTKLMIIDEHLDDEFFEYTDIVPDNIQIQIITGEKKPIFWTLLSELKKKRQGIEARINNVSHCRYIIIDDSLIYSTDASLNTIGKKDFMIHKLEDDAEIAKVKNEVQGYWTNAKIKQENEQPTEPIKL